MPTLLPTLLPSLVPTSTFGPSPVPTFAAKFSVSSFAAFRGFSGTSEWTDEHIAAYEAALAASLPMVNSPGDVTVTGAELQAKRLQEEEQQQLSRQ